MSSILRCYLKKQELCVQPFAEPWATESAEMTLTFGDQVAFTEVADLKVHLCVCVSVWCVCVRACLFSYACTSVCWMLCNVHVQHKIWYKASFVKHIKQSCTHLQSTSNTYLRWCSFTCVIIWIKTKHSTADEMLFKSVCFSIFSIHC